MAICHIAIKQGTRSGGQSAEAKDDYLERNGRYGGKDGKRKNGVLLSESGNMPAWAKTPREYWKAADQYERANGRLFIQVEFALPVELSEEQQIELSREFSEKLTGPGCLPYTMAIHAEDTDNPHCHLMISERRNDGIGRSPDTWFRKADAKASPGAKKTDEFQKLDSYWNMRVTWAGLANNALERAGLAERLDPRTLEAQGKGREAQIHEGRSPERKAENEEIKRRNARRAEMENALVSIDRERQELDGLETEISRSVESGSAEPIGGGAGPEEPKNSEEEMPGLQPEWQGMAAEYAELEACHDALEKRSEQAAFTESRMEKSGHTASGLEYLERLKALEREAAEDLEAQKERMRRRGRERPEETRAEMQTLGFSRRTEVLSLVPEMRAYAAVPEVSEAPEAHPSPEREEEQTEGMAAAPARATETAAEEEKAQEAGAAEGETAIKKDSGALTSGQAQPARPRATYTELKEYRDGLAARLDAEAQKIARHGIAEARRKQIEAEAKRIKAEKAAIYGSYCDAVADRDAHYEKEPPEPLFLGRGKWELEHGRWKSQLDAMQRMVAGLWEKAGGDMGLKHTGYGKEEVARRLTDGYALEEAKKIYDKSDEWKATLENINERAFLEAARRDPETKKALDEANRELTELEAKERLDRRIAELDGKLSNPPYWIGSAGYPKREAAADARELLRLESMRLYDESGGQIRQDYALKKAIERHPVVADIERKLGRDRGMGR